jgi:hypothetical protein
MSFSAVFIHIRLSFLLSISKKKVCFGYQSKLGALVEGVLCDLIHVCMLWHVYSHKLLNVFKLGWERERERER